MTEELIVKNVLAEIFHQNIPLLMNIESETCSRCGQEIYEVFLKSGVGVSFVCVFKLMDVILSLKFPFL